MPRDFIQELTRYSPKLGFDLAHVEQGSEQWKQIRLGVITASRAHDLIKKGQGNKPSVASEKYMLELIAEVCTSVGKSASSRSMSWGIENEPKARALYQFISDTEVKELPFIYKDKSLRVGCSPDGITDDRGVEIKCPYDSSVHLNLIINDVIKPEYVTQCQFSMWVTGLTQWDFVSYDPRMTGKELKVVSLEADEEIHKRFDEVVPSFIEQMDQRLSDLNRRFGQQWTNSC